MSALTEDILRPVKAELTAAQVRERRQAVDRVLLRAMTVEDPSRMLEN